MKKKTIRLPVILLCLILVLQLAPVAVQADSEAPYGTYTFDKWGNAVPSPNAYLPTRSIGGAQLGCGSFNNAQDLFYSQAQGEVYIADSGNKRVLVLSEDMELVRELSTLTREDGTEYQFGEPRGIFVKDDGTMYVADMGNKEVVVCTNRGQYLSTLPTPESNLLPDDFNYLPTKVVVDAKNRIYILSQGVYQGLIYLDTDGSFIKFFGSNDVEMTLQRRLQKTWKTILSDEAAATMQSFNPIEYGNIFLTEDGYIYATAAGSENGTSLMTKLNPLGTDCLPYKFAGSNSPFNDVAVNADGITTLIDTQRGEIWQLDENGNTMFLFGGVGNQTGLFQRPVSVIEVNDNLYVMDADKNTITEFSLTEYGALVREAIALYNAGLYQECMEPWREVIRHNSNYLLAYTGLGKAYYQLKDYDTAMYYFKLANGRTDYSVAFREASLNHMRDSFGGIVLVLAVLLAAALIWKRLRRRGWPERAKHKKPLKPGRNGGKE